MPRNARPKADGPAPARGARASATGSESAPRAAAKGNEGARDAEAGRGGRAPVLLTGGNPQIPKGDGDAPVQAYIAGMPGWKRDVGRRLDALVTRTLPDVRKAVRWNSPFYGTEAHGWFLSVHCFTKYVKVTFFNGTSLRPLPPVASKQEETRFLHIHEGDEIDEDQLASWIRQAAAKPGWVL